MATLESIFARGQDWVPRRDLDEALDALEDALKAAGQLEADVRSAITAFVTDHESGQALAEDCEEAANRHAAKRAT